MFNSIRHVFNQDSFRDAPSFLSFSPKYSNNGSVKITQISESFQNGENKPDFFRRLPSKGISLRDAEIELIKKSLEYFGDNRSLTAKALGISRKSLYERIQRYGLDDRTRKV